MEKLVRDVSTQMGKVLRVFTGTYGILNKKTKTGKMLDVYLDPIGKRIEVPLIVWKLVVDVKTNDSVAFFSSNDIDMDEEEKSIFSTICDSVCDELAYYFNEDAKAGYTICCNYQDFIKHIQFLPFKLANSNLLKNPVHIEHTFTLKKPLRRTNSMGNLESSIKSKSKIRRTSSDSKLVSCRNSSK